MAVAPEQTLTPDLDAIEAHLAHITRRWHELGEDCLLEVAFLTAEDAPRIEARRFRPNQVGEAAQQVVAMNQKGHNAYAVVNPVRASAEIEPGKRASREHIAAAFFHWADADTAEAAENIRSLVSVKCTFSVVTGTTPFPRPHVYWELEEPTRDFEAWQRTQKAIAATLKSDSSVTDPPRIMRLGGTVNWPKPKKQDKGYVPEITTLRLFEPEVRPPVSADRMARAFVPPASAPAPASALSQHDRDERSSEASFLAALRYVPPSLSHEAGWLECLMAIHDFYGGSGRGLDVAKEWSSGDTRYSPQELDAKWKSFGTGKGVSYRSVFHHARVHGADLGQIARLDRPERAHSAPRSEPPAYLDAPPHTEEDARLEAEPDLEPRGPTIIKSALSDDPDDPDREFDLRGLTPDDLKDIPPRRWLYGRKLVRSFCSILASPGGTAKSSLVAAIAGDLATGRPSLHDEPHGKLRSWIYNLEDPRDETLRKMAALWRLRGLSADDLSRIIVTSGRDRSLILAQEVERGVVVATPDVERVVRAIKKHRIDFLCVDPFVRAHRLTENDNKHIDFIMDLFARIADEANCAILLVHHTRKGFVAGDTDSIRGGSAMSSAARVALTLQAMTPEEAEELNIPEGDRRTYVRVDSAKANLAPAPDAAEWVKLESVNLDNGTDEYPDGDQVQAVVAWHPPSPWEGVDGRTFDILDRIVAGYTHSDGTTEPWSFNKRAGDRWVGNAVLAAFPTAQKSEAQAKRIIGTWKSKGFITEYEYTTPNRKKAMGVQVSGRPERA